MSAIGNILRPLLLAPVQKEEGDLPSYIKALENGKFKDRICFGISDKKRGFYTLDPVQQPGSLFCGGMGSGKSVSMRFTSATHMAANSENTFYVFMDAVKGMTDYLPLFDNSIVDTSSGVAYGLNETSKIVPLVDMVYAETMARKEEFSRVGANNIYEYDKRMKKQQPGYPGIARIMIFIEEFHALPASEVVKFSMNVDRPGSIAEKLKMLMRIGRSYGIFFNLATQRATYDDVPGALKPGISTMLCFKMNNVGDAAAMNLPHAAEISVEQRGRCAYEDGFIQFPYLDDNALAALLRRYYKPFKAKMLKYSVEDFRTALLEEGTSGMVKVKPLSEVVKFWNSFDFKDIVTRVLNIFNYSVEEQRNPAYQVELIAEKNGKRYGVKLMKDRKDTDPKKVASIKQGVKALGLENEIILFFVENQAAGALANDKLFKIVDYEDLTQIGHIVDNREKLEKEGKFREMYLNLPLAVESDMVQLLEAPDDEEIEEVEMLIPAQPKKAEVEKKAPAENPEIAEAKLVAKEIELPETDYEEYDYNYLSVRGMLDDVELVHKIIFGKEVRVLNMEPEKREELIKKHGINKDTTFMNYFYMVNQGLHKKPIELKKILTDPNLKITNIEAEQLAQLHASVKEYEAKANLSEEEIKKNNEKLMEELADVFDADEPETELEKLKKLGEEKNKPIKPVMNTEALENLRKKLKRDLES